MSKNVFEVLGIKVVIYGFKVCDSIKNERNKAIKKDKSLRKLTV